MICSKQLLVQPPEFLGVRTEDEVPATEETLLEVVQEVGRVP
uniref:Uncharacterized protein n=1 Tax=Nelumbo nucifera TaxID=4432 RepID=A0A822XVR4_NELNU|nr:TPA_asm: hypothetical protein HUJ06_024328 [Nelumbo nucifera]